MRVSRQARGARTFRPVVLGDSSQVELLEGRQLLNAAAAVWAFAKPTAQTIHRADAIVYLPANVRPGGHYPTVVAFTPDGKLQRTLGEWKSVADKRGWVVYVSSQYSNRAAAAGRDSLMATVKASLDDTLAGLPVDRSRVVLSGFSGGGDFAEVFNARHPGFAAGLVIIGNAQYAYGEEHGEPFPTAAFAGSRRLAVFLNSVPRGRVSYELMTEVSFYAQRGWSTLSLNYPGGHVDAPISVYQRVSAWMIKQPSWLA